MRVGLNLEQLVQDGVSGIATYTAELARHLPQHGWEVTAFTARHPRAQVDAALEAAGLTGLDPVRLPLPRPALYDAWHTVGTADPLRRIAPVDLVHAPSVAVPPVRDVPLVVTAHDAAPVTFPETYSRRGRWFHERGFAATAKRARLVIAVSEFSADELATHTPIRRDRIRVVPNGVHLARADADEIARARSAVGLRDRPYVLWVGTLQPRKNVGMLVDAFERAVADGVPHTLVLVGAPGWSGGGAEGGDASRVTPSDAVVVTGPVAPPALSGLYAGADLLAFPSLHEGFGLPALEAMAQGTAVLASDIPALREVAGGAARFVAPTDVDGWHRAFVELLGDAATRESMGASGLAHAQQYSWDTCAARTAAVYQEALG
ncbi:MAG TPA: glycosyltransferase family 1 protein [Acidimicrobiia bacterium]|nr:glycosyltransferase family 1 protein [Acidimicrobiia bacterium]